MHVLPSHLPSRKISSEISSEADQLQRELGKAGAVELVRRRIAEADREARRRLYLLHDEIARR